MESNNPSLLVHEIRDSILMEIANLGDDDLVTQFTEEVTSESADENYSVAGGPARLEELTDEVHLTSMSDGQVNLTNREFMGGMLFKKKDLEDDRRGIIRRRVGEWVGELSDQRRGLILEALTSNSNAGSLGYDGVNFFSNAHPPRGPFQSANQSNLVTATGQTTAAVATDLASVIAAMMGFTDERGRTITRKLTKLGIIAHPSLKRSMDEAVKSVLISNTSNVQVSGMEVVLYYAGELTAANTWFAFNLSRKVRPFLLQSRLAPEITEEEIKKASEYAFYARVRNAAVMTNWALGARVA